MRRMWEITIAVGIVTAMAVLAPRWLPTKSATSQVANGGYPDRIGDRYVTSIADAIASTKTGESVAVSGFLVLDWSACGKAASGPYAQCSGAFLWERPLADPWYGGSRISLAIDDVAKRLGPALGIQDWGVPVVANGTVLEGECRRDGVCHGVLLLDEIAWVGEPIPEALSTNPSGSMATLGDSRFLAPEGWHVRAEADAWIISSPAEEVAMMVSKRATPAWTPANGVWDAYPGAQSIVYEYGSNLVVWTVELGDSAATRQTVIGYSDGVSEYELKLTWADAGVWVGAARLALSGVIAGLTDEEASAR
jgi:hypothetical protein